MPRIPTFKFHGSKCRIAKWIFGDMPNNLLVDSYYEPFAGRGNTFFYFASRFSFQSAHLNDLYMAHFLRALRDYSGTYDFVPQYIDRATYDRLYQHPNTQERSLAESFCAYNGTFWGGGANITSSPTKPSKNKHSRTNTIKRFQEARRLLHGVEIHELDYVDFISRLSLNSSDLMYCDPPYLQSQKCKLKDMTIDHDKLASILVQLPCKVILSGYQNAIYDTILTGWNVHEHQRASCGKNSNHTSNYVTERKWQNF
jgi:site-specific DNA-adenine methylase